MTRRDPPTAPIAGALRDGIGRLEVIAGAGHFLWKDDPAAYWRVIGDFIAETA